MTKKNLAPSGIRVNGCTAAPNLDFKSCCDDHDRDYAVAGGIVQRFRADWRLAKCIICRSKLLLRYILAPIYFIGVRVGGLLFFDWWWRVRWRRLDEARNLRAGWYLLRWTDADAPVRVYLRRQPICVVEGSRNTPVISYDPLKIIEDWEFGYDKADAWADPEPLSLGVENPAAILWRKDHGDAERAETVKTDGGEEPGE